MVDRKVVRFALDTVTVYAAHFTAFGEGPITSRWSLVVPRGHWDAAGGPLEMELEVIEPQEVT